MWESKQTTEEWKADTKELEGKINDEEQLWQAQQFHHGMIEVNTYLIQIKLNVLLTFLQDEFGVTDEELEARFKFEVLTQLKRDRAMLIEHQMKAQRPDMAVVKHQLLGPTGRPIL